MSHYGTPKGYARGLRDGTADGEESARSIVQELRDLIEEAHDTHIYCELNGDEHPDDCAYCAAVQRADAFLKGGAK